MKKHKDTEWLFVAAKEGDLDGLKALVAKGAVVNWKNHLDDTALMMAAERGNADCVQALIAAGADLNAQQGKNCRLTALIYAAKESNTDCVKALAAAGADLDTRDHVGHTALIKAAVNGHVGCVQALIAAGADVNAKDDNGTTALRLARRRVKGILRAAGAKRKIHKADFQLIGLVLVWVAFAFGIAALMNRLSPSLPTWGAGLLGIVSAPAIVFCVAASIGYFDYSAYRRLLLFGWAVLAFGIAALMHWLSLWSPTWVVAGLFGTLAAPIICPVVLLLPEPKRSVGDIVKGFWKRLFGGGTKTAEAQPRIRYEESLTLPPEFDGRMSYRDMFRTLTPERLRAICRALPIEQLDLNRPGRPPNAEQMGQAITQVFAVSIYMATGEVAREFGDIVFPRLVSQIAKYKGAELHIELCDLVRDFAIHLTSARRSRDALQVLNVLKGSLFWHAFPQGNACLFVALTHIADETKLRADYEAALRVAEQIPAGQIDDVLREGIKGLKQRMSASLR